MKAHDRTYGGGRCDDCTYAAGFVAGLQMALDRTRAKPTPEGDMIIGGYPTL